MVELEKKQREEKEKNKTKSIYSIYAVLTVLVLIGLVVLVLILIEKQKVLKEINNNYSERIIIKNNTKIYDKKKGQIGSIKKGYSFELSKIDTKQIKQKYFNIKDTSFYLYYKDIKPNKKRIKKSNIHYIVFNKNIKTRKKTNFYDDNKIVMSINKSLEIPIQYMDDKNYYVNYLGNFLKIKKDKGIKEIEHNNTEEKEVNNISVLHFNNIVDNDSCKEETCISYKKIQEYIKYLKEQGYYSISIDEYKAFLNKNIRLKEKAILLTTSNDNEIVKKNNKENEFKLEVINDKIGIKFNDSNKVSSKDSDINSVNRYIVKNTTNDEDFHKMVNGEEIVQKIVITTPGKEQSIAVINYHFFYDSSKGEYCGENICLDVSNFREQLNYLRDNGYKTLKMEEFTKWMYGEIELPEKSVLLTVDDGAFGTGKHNGNHLITILEEYNMNATLFLITGWWDVENYRSKNLDIQSHTNDMHQYGTCGQGQVVCATKEELKADLQKSLSIVDNNNSFCFPFYKYSNLAVETVKEVGFKTAFVGGNRKAKRSDNKFLIPRYPIYKGTTLEQFKLMVG